MRELLLLLCHYPFDESNREILSKLIREVRDWPELLRLINDHGIIALATYNLKEAKLVKEIPGDAMSILENGYLRSLGRNTWLSQQWIEVNTVLGKAGIKHILLKGMALEHTLYGAKGLRQMTDNDLLLKYEDSIKAWYLLQNEGFSHQLIKSALHKKIIFDTGKHLPTLYRNGYAIDIHNSLHESEVSSKENNTDPFFNSVEFTIGASKALALSNEMHLNYLKNHFNRHKLEGYCQLRLYADILLLDNSTKIDIPESFIYNPNQGNKPEFRKAAYKATIMGIQSKYRLQYIIGDLFPSLKWMKMRYKCNGLKVLFSYPLRVGKLLWLL